jgi:hypothetical protein
MAVKKPDAMPTIIKKQLADWKIKPSQVHQNDCDTFARRVLTKARKHGLKGIQPKVCDDTIHVFLQYKGKSYDAANPNGVKDWRDLKDTQTFMRRNKRSRKSMRARNTKLSTRLRLTRRRKTS